MLKLTLPFRKSRQTVPAPRVAIVGGGFTGASIARLLALRSPCAGSNGLGSITVFEPRASLGSGLAYDAKNEEMRLHVAAHRMRATPGNPGAFLNWLKLSGRLDDDPQSNIGGAIYARRRDFGDFMQAQLAPHIESGRIRHIQNKVLSIERRNGHWLVWDHSGMSQAIDIVVIATSNPPPANIFNVTDEIEYGAENKQSIHSTDTVAIVGAGLTAMDLVLSLRARGHQGSITLVSRSGLLHRQQPEGDFMPHGEAMFRQPRTAIELLRAVRQATSRIAADGLPWQSVMDALRHEASDLWPRLPTLERKRIKRHLLRWYEVHRQRMAPDMAKYVNEMQRSGQLVVLAGRIQTVERKGLKTRVTIDPKRKGQPVRLDVHHLLNASGPDYGNVIAHHRYLRELQASGFIMPDQYGFGLACDRNSMAIAKDGYPVQDLYIAGPLARGAFGELTAVPEIAAQADHISRSIMASGGRRTRTVFIRSLAAAAINHSIQP